MSRAISVDLPRDVVADIFVGKIGHWDDPRIESANPSASLPHRTMYKSYPDAAKRDALKDAVIWGLIKGQPIAEQMGYIPLPDQMVAMAKSQLQQIKQHLRRRAPSTKAHGPGARFERINATLDTPRDPLSDAVLDRMMQGYAQVDTYLDARVDLFAPGNSALLLELNILVLCGRDAEVRSECASQIAATEEHFYANTDGAVGAPVHWVKGLNGEPAWRRAASTYIHILSQPQLYLEGNHRTGSLVMSWMLARKGKPPFVLSVDNAKAYFDPSALVKSSRKHSLRMLLERPKLVKRFADLLKDDAEKTHLDA